MGILNVTPDSFSDGGQALAPSQAERHAEALLAAGADILDLGAESTRPQASPITAATELARLRPVLANLRRRFPQTPLSVDTYKAEVARVALEEGADIINDVSGGRHEATGEHSPIGAVCAQADCPLILTHRRAEPIYEDFWPDLLHDLKGSIRLARLAGMRPEQLWTDPGIGFGKTPAQNLALIRDLARVAALGFPVLLGASRKSTIGLVLNEPDPLRRESGHHVALAWGIAQGCAMIRAHDISAIRAAVQMADALRNGLQWRAPNPVKGEPAIGLEPMTCRLQGGCSTN